jgi:predicted dehydrogenase
MATDLDSCFLLEKESLRLDRRVIVCHVLRHTPFFSALKGLVDSGAVGRLLTVSLNECIGYYHFAHSYVRGNWRSGALSSPAILAKSSHDMDILHWLIGSPSSSVSSTGDRVWFRKENAPPDAPARCLDGCRHRDDCPFYAPRWYLTEDTGWPASVISEDTSLAARIEALRTGPYGRCVYACDNDVVDHQAVIIRFENGVIATFTLSAFTREITRTIRLMGSKGEISGDLRKGEIEISDFLSGSRQLMRVEAAETGHQGGDEGLMREVERVIRSEDSEIKSRSDISEAMESHRLCFAAERARLGSVVVDMDEFRRPG